MIARIAETAEVAAKQVSVSASQPVAADLVGASAGVGVVGVGISASVAILRSNVLAASLGKITGATGGVSVTAESKAGTLKNDTAAAQRDSDVKALLNDDLDVVGNRAIRAIGVAFGAGEISPAVGVGVVLTDNITSATLGGSVTGSGDVKVSATHNYGTVLAATGAASGGAVSAAASVAAAQANGTVKAGINRDAVLDVTGGVSVTTDSTVHVDAAAAAAAVGAIAGNAGVAVAINRLNQTTGIEAGTSVTAKGDVKVAATSDTAANSYLLGVDAGAIAMGLNAAVSDVSANVNTFIGQSMPTRAGDTSDNMPAAVVSARDVILTNTVSSAAKPMLLSVSAGAISATGNALLAFNQTDAAAIAENADITAARNLDIYGNLSGSAESTLTTADVGAITVGLSANYADMAAANRASLNNSKVNVSGWMHVLTNWDGASTSAKADTVAGQVGLGTVGLNAAIARNNTKSYATVIGDREMTVAGETLIRGQGKSTAEATFTGQSALCSAPTHQVTPISIVRRRS